MDLNSSIGAIEIGVMVSIFLFGLVTVQVFSYYKKFPNDSRLLKAFVGAVWLLELTHTALTAYSIYFVTIVKYGQEQFIDQLNRDKSLIAVVSLSGIIGSAVQAFFAERVRRLSSSWIIPIICWILCFLRCTSVIAVAAVQYHSGSIKDFRKNWVWLLATSLSISAAVDVVIALSLCYYLWRRRDSGLEGMKRVVDRLILWSIQTGLLTSVSAVTMLIMFVAVQNFAWLAMFFIISRLFANSLMASLNARSTFRGNRVQLVEENSSFRMQPTSRNVNITMTRVTEHWVPERELRKTRAIDQDSASSHTSGIRNSGV